MEQQNYISSVRNLFVYYKTLGEKAMDQIEPAKLFAAANDQSNSIAIIVRHLSGNMLSRWTDFLTSDGEKTWRNRDAEFSEANGEFIDAETAKADLLAQWEIGWKCLFNAVDELQPSHLSDIIYIRNEGHTVMEALNRQLAHYSYHVGQIVFYSKLLNDGQWESLSIPRNNSAQYNAEKFSADKSTGDFTKAELNRLQ